MEIIILEIGLMGKNKVRVNCIISVEFYISKENL